MIGPRLLLISSSKVHGYGFLDHAEVEIRAIAANGPVAFIPFALADVNGYTDRVRERLAKMSIEVDQVHRPSDLDRAGAVFVGGGNTFRLLKTLYDRNMLREIRERVLAGLPYIGSSAGTVIAGPTMKTTNDMPIVEPPSFTALGLVRFQINPHYLDPDPQSTHQGETREERIGEFLEENETTVVGLREGTMLKVEDGTTRLLGLKNARVFKRRQQPVEVEPGSVLERYV